MAKKDKKLGQVPTIAHGAYGVEIPCSGGEGKCIFCNLSHHIRSHSENLVGQLLTLVEATAVDSEQRKALKDMVRNIIWDTTDRHREGVYWMVHHFDSESKGQDQVGLQRISK